MGISNDFYPSIKTLISKDSVSQKIGTVQGGLDLVLDNLFYKELILQQSRLKDSIFAIFSIVSYKRLGLEFPGTGGLSLILNPGIDSQTFTEFPVSLSLQNPVKRFLSKVSITSLSQDPNEIFSLLRKLARSEEHTSELQSRPHLVCRLLLEKKNNKNYNLIILY